MIEKEIILLRSAYDHLGDMVNPSMIEIRDDKPHLYIQFQNFAQRKLFFILLVDFLSVTDKRGPIGQTSFLGGLNDICESPHFSIDDSISELKDAVTKFREWLTVEKNISIWLPELKEEISISISRVDAIKMSGDVSKHNYLRSIGVAEKLMLILKKSGINIELENALVSLPEFYERFHEDILIYISSQICEFLNNIKLGIYSYMFPEFKRSYQPSKDNFTPYNYLMPDSIKSRYAINSYWSLMNDLRFKPYFQKFHISEYFKKDEY